jgi:hypothetical protein
LTIYGKAPSTYGQSFPLFAIDMRPPQYQVLVAANPIVAGLTSPSGNNMYSSGYTINPLVANPNSGYIFSSWSITGAIDINDQFSSSTRATVNGPGTITANFYGIESLFPTVIQNPYASGSYISGTLSDLQSDNNQNYISRSTTSGTRTLDYYLEFTAPLSAGKVKTELTVTQTGYYSIDRTQRLQLFNFNTNSWFEIDNHNINNDHTRTITLTSDIGNYVSSSNSIRLRILTSGGSTNYDFYNDFVKIDLIYIP